MEFSRIISYARRIYGFFGTNPLEHGARSSIAKENKAFDFG